MKNPTCQFENVGRGSICGQPAFLQEWSGRYFCLAHGMPIVTRWAVPWRPLNAPARQYGTHRRLWYKLKRLHQRVAQLPPGNGGKVNLIRRFNPLVRESDRIRAKLMREQARLAKIERRRREHEAALVLVKMEAQARLDGARRQHLINEYELFRDGSGPS